MLFNSYPFLLVFLPLALLGAILARRLPGGGERGTKVWIAFASLVFYAWWSLDFLVILLGSITANFGLLRLALRQPLGSGRRKAAVATGALLNLSLLGWFKYAGFLAFNLNALTGAHVDVGQILLPLGISFFSFQKIALLIDVQRGDIDDIEFFDYLLFVTFFPQLIAGPIVLFTEVRPQFDSPGRLGVRWGNLAVGLSIFAIGLAKKTLIADEMAQFATPLFDAAAKGALLTGADAWTGALAYAFQIYFDFSGYSDMAIGLAWMFGIALPYNFNSPYKATSIVDFWHRWHVTLSRFLRVYLYIPLGGNRLGPARRYVNLITVMLIGGLWHGAAWTFVVWGLLHGLYLSVNHAWRALGIAAPSARPARLLATGASWLVTFLAVVVAWVLFRAASFESAWNILATMFDPKAIADMIAHGYPEKRLIPHSNVAPQELAATLAAVLVLPNTLDILANHFPHVAGHEIANKGVLRLRWHPSTAWAGFVAACLAVGILGLSRPQVFIYFQF